MRRIQISLAVVSALSVGFALTPALAPAKAHKKPHVCKGTQAAPGVLSGKFKSGVEVKGFCEVKGGPAAVTGQLTVRKGSVLIAEFGLDHAKLTVKGDVLIEKGATVLLGCGTKESICLDDPNQVHPTIKSLDTVSGNMIEKAPLGVITHVTTIGGDVIESGGGGGLNCTPTGVFATLIMAPVFSDYEDGTIGGNLVISHLTSCYLGVARMHVKGNIRLLKDKFADGDAIEILANHVKHDLVCRHDSAVWDNAEEPTNPQGAIFPRTAPMRNKVHGKRLGQCKKASPMTMGGTSSGPF